MNIWFTSDLHFCHNKPFLYESRGFTSVENMNRAIVDNYNELVQKQDTVYILGDIMLQDNKKGLELFSELNGQLYIIRGNHDTDARIKLYRSLSNVQEVVDAKFLNIENVHLFLSHYPVVTTNFRPEHQIFTQRINLCGHTHTKDRFSDFSHGLIYHVEVDAHDMKPVHISEILFDIYKKVEGK